MFGETVGITLRNKLQKLQNRAARVLTYSNYDVDAGHLFKLLGWKNLACQQQIQRATMVYRSLHGLAPKYLRSKFERRETEYKLQNRATRVLTYSNGDVDGGHLFKRLG